MTAAIIVASVVFIGAGRGASAGAAPNYLSGIACPSATSCFAVGEYFTGPSTGKTLVERWNGSGWSVVPSPNVTSGSNSDSELRSVACASTTSCFAVGFGRPSNGDEKTLIEHWNGTSWSVVPSPNPAAGGHYNEFLSVSCISAASCFAVGFSGSGPSIKTLIEHWNGTKWSIVASPNPAGATVSMLQGVTCISARCFAVGFVTNPSPATIIERWNGSAWSLMTSPPMPNGTVPGLYAVACKSSTRCFAVGSVERGATTTSLIELFNGTGWSVLPSPNPAGVEETRLSGVTCSSSTTCFTTGYVVSDFGSTFQTFIARWNGTTWNRVPSPNVSPTLTELGGVTCASSPKPCFAVGSSANTSETSVIERWNGTSWVLQAHPQP